MPFDSTSFGGTLYKNPLPPIQNQQQYNAVAAGPRAGYELGDTISGSGVAPGSALAKQQQAAAEPTPSKPGVAPTGARPVAPVVPPSFASDPNVALAKALENQGIGSLDAWLRSAREQAIIQSGDPALAAQAGFGLDPQAGAFAQQNYLSGNADLARVKRAQDLAHQAIINKLAAHGIIRSGDLGYLEGQSNIDFGNQEYDVRQAVLNKLSDLMKQYLDQKQALQQSTLSAYQQAYQNAASSPSGYAADTNTAPAPVTPAAQVVSNYLASAGGKALSAKSKALNKLYGLG